MATNANRFTQTAHSGGSHQPAEFPGVAAQFVAEKLTAQQEQDEKLLALIRQLRHERSEPDAVLNEIELLMGHPGAKKFWHRMLALRDWLRADREAHE